jgi:hypothetical protein
VLGLPAAGAGVGQDSRGGPDDHHRQIATGVAGADLFVVAALGVAVPRVILTALGLAFLTAFMLVP